jgi:lipopolysaccharide/colanic/teichoic acid biosynthesis glycosyltransferase
VSDAFKRLFDLMLASTGLLVLSPAFVAVAIAIKATSEGPVFFRQTRIGRGERPFRILKFRTMIAEASSTGPQITVGADSRITRIGLFLRKYKLDELPQLINVIHGDMSLVGPRPETPDYVSLYPVEERREIFTIRPGITDEAAIEFRNESEILASVPDPLHYYVDVILPRKRAFYLQYARHRTFLGDIGIIWRTIQAIFDRSRPNHEQATQR